MLLKINKKKLELVEPSNLFERFKILKFYLKPLDFGVVFKKRFIISTYYLCQKVDIVLADKDNNIIKVLPSVKSEKWIRRRRKTYYVYYLPEGTVKGIDQSKPLKFIKNKEEKSK